MIGSNSSATNIAYNISEMNMKEKNILRSKAKRDNFKSLFRIHLRRFYLISHKHK